MLDAYIIDRIRRERERDREEGAFVPLRIEPPPTAPTRVPPPEARRDDDNERGSVIIDFTL